MKLIYLIILFNVLTELILNKCYSPIFKLTSYPPLEEFTKIDTKLTLLMYNVNEANNSIIPLYKNETKKLRLLNEYTSTYEKLKNNVKDYVNNKYGDNTLNDFKFEDVVKYLKTINKEKEILSNNICIDQSRVGYNDEVMEATTMEINCQVPSCDQLQYLLLEYEFKQYTHCDYNQAELGQYIKGVGLGKNKGTFNAFYDLLRNSFLPQSNLSKEEANNILDFNCNNQNCQKMKKLNFTHVMIQMEQINNISKPLLCTLKAKGFVKISNSYTKKFENKDILKENAESNQVEREIIQTDSTIKTILTCILIVFGIFLIIMCIFIIWYCKKYHKNKKYPKNEQEYERTDIFPEQENFQ